MEKAVIWDSIHAERRALAADVDGVGDPEWATGSLCQDWTVRDVLAHLTATAKLSTGRFFPKLVASGVSLRRMQAKGARRPLTTSAAKGHTRPITERNDR